ncbi:accessory gene regulator B family protein [Anaerocolumna sp. AGMB13025]|uniref:accessory gene regulator B family protein n=1 Tax=Anaerocolumna sp. AGMB13025 TaxID=3039116 RepID=UPI003FA409D8
MNRLAEFLCNKALAVKAIESEEKDLYRYAFSLLISSVYTWGTFILLGLFFDSLLAAICFMILFIPLRIFCGGFHRENYSKCYTSSLFLFFSIFIISKVPFLDILNLGLFVSLPIVIWCIWKFAPIEDNNKPLSSSEIIKYSRISKNILVLEVTIVSLFFLNQLEPLIIYFSLTALHMIGFLLGLRVIQNLINRKHINFKSKP